MNTDNHKPHPQGGQHRPSAGVSTWEGETEPERGERLRRAHEAVTAELGEFWRSAEAAIKEEFGQPDVAF